MVRSCEPLVAGLLIGLALVSILLISAHHRKGAHSFHKLETSPLQEILDEVEFLPCSTAPVDSIPLPGIDHVYLMGLERRKDRVTRMSSILRFMHVDYEFVPASDGQYIQQLIDSGRTNEFKSITTLNLTEQLANRWPESMGAFACLHTALRIMHDIKDHDWNALVLEDDVDLEYNIRDVLSGLLPHLPSDWSKETLFVQYESQSLGALRLGNCYEKEGEEIWGPIKRSTSFLCPHATIYHGYSAASWILDRLDKPWLYRTNWDELMLAEVFKEGQKDFVSYTLFPSPIVQTNRKSGDIPTSAAKWQNPLQQSATELLVQYLQEMIPS